MKKVLMICYWFPPCSKVGAFRSAAFAKYLPEFGWEPWIVTPKEKYVLRGGMESALEEIEQKSRIIRTDTFEPILRARLKKLMLKKQNPAKALENFEPVLDKNHRTKKPLLQRLRELSQLPDEHLGWIPYVVQTAWKYRKQWDVLYTTSGPPSGFVAGYIIKSLTGKPWLADFRDPWTWRGKTIFPTTLHRNICVGLERNGVAAADAVTTVTPSMTEMMSELAPNQRGKFDTVYNGFDKSLLIEQPAAPRNNKPFRIICPGTLYRGRNPRPLLEAISGLIRSGKIQRGDVLMEFIGNGVEYLQPVAENLGIAAEVKISKPVPPDKILQMIERADIGLLPIAEFIGEIALPTKIFDYLACRKPILALGKADTQPARFIRENQFGWVVNPQNIELLAQLLQRLINRDSQVMKEISITPDKIDKFHRKTQTGRLAEILDRLFIKNAREAE